MGPLEMVLAKDALCEALERYWGSKSTEPVQRILAVATEADLEAEFQSLGMELMAKGKKAEGWEFVKVWRRFKPEGGDDSNAKGADRSQDEEEDEEGAPAAPSLAKGLAMGLGKAFSGKPGRSTTDQLAAAAGATLDNAGSVTEWQGDDELSAAAKRMFANGKIGIELAKAEAAAIVRSKLGSKASKIVERVEASRTEADLALAIGEAQRKLVKAGMPRLAAKMAKKWLELCGRIE